MFLLVFKAIKNWFVKIFLFLQKNGGEKRDNLGNTVTKEKCGFLQVEEGSGTLTKDPI